MISSVYFIQVDPLGPIKIGTTAGHISLRMRALQQTSPHILKWIGWFKGGPKEELEAHHLLANYRMRGEWFYPTREVLDFIAEKSPGFDEKKFNDEVFMEAERLLVKKAIPPWDRDSNRRSTIMEASGFGPSDLNKWLTRMQPADPVKATKAAACAAELLRVAQ